MESKRIILFDELIRKNSDAYIKLSDCDVLIYSKFLDFEYIRRAIDRYKSKKMYFEMINDLPILLDIDINRNIFDILYNQLLTGLTPTFNSVDDQIYYILLLEHLTGGDSLEIQEITKLIKFDISTYIELVEYGFNLLNYINKNITINNIISGFLSKYKLSIINKYNYNSLCKFDLKCKSHYDSAYNCKWRHSPKIMNDEIRCNLISDLSRYNILYIGEKEIFRKSKHHKHNTHNYDKKLLSYDNIIFDIIFEEKFSFALNPRKFIDRDKYEYNNYDEYDEEEISILTVDGKLNKFRYVALFKPYECCGKSIFYHSHGN
jgi:hypothetical protein